MDIPIAGDDTLDALHGCVCKCAIKRVLIVLSPSLMRSGRSGKEAVSGRWTERKELANLNRKYDGSSPEFWRGKEIAREISTTVAQRGPRLGAIEAKDRNQRTGEAVDEFFSFL